MEAVRDPGLADFGATFFLPVENEPAEEEDADDHEAQTYRLCVRCAERFVVHQDRTRCGDGAEIFLQQQSRAKEREDQVPRCAVCGYHRDPVREVMHGTDGPHAVIATTLYQELAEDRKKVLAFADGRQEAAFFAWYLEDSYNKILGRNPLLKVAQSRLRVPWRDCPCRIWLRVCATCSAEAFSVGNERPAVAARGLAGPLSGISDRRTSNFCRRRWPFALGSEVAGLVSNADALRTAPWSLSEREARMVVFILFDSMRADRAVELQTENNVSLNWTDLLLQAAQMRFSPVEKGKLRHAERKWAGPTGKRVRFLEKLYRRISAGASDKEASDAAVLVLRDVWETLRRCDEHAPTSNDRLLIRVEDARRLNPDWWRLRFVGEDDEVYRCETCGRIQAASVRGLCSRHRCPGSLSAIRRRALEPNHYRLLYQAELPGSLRVEEHTAQLDSEKAREFQRDFSKGKIHFLSCSTTFELGVDLGDLDTIFLRNVPPEAFNYAQRVGRSGRRSGHAGFAITYCKRGPHDLYHFAEPDRMLKGKIQPPVWPCGMKKSSPGTLWRWPCPSFSGFSKRGFPVSRAS